MKYSFTCYGHKNITAKHKTTLEFTKDSEFTEEDALRFGREVTAKAAKIHAK